MQKSNVAELLITEEVKALLRLCKPKWGEPETESDYDRFFGLCESLRLFYGHPLFESAHGYLKQYFDLDLPIIPQNAEKLWLLTGDYLLRTNKTIPTLSIAETTDISILPPLSAGGAYNTFLALILSQTDARSWCEWFFTGEC